MKIIEPIQWRKRSGNTNVWFQDLEKNSETPVDLLNYGHGLLCAHCLLLKTKKIKDEVLEVIFQTFYTMHMQREKKRIID